MVLVEMATEEVKGAIDDYSLGSTQPWVSSDVKILLIDFEIAIFSSSGVEHGLSRCWTTWRAQRAPWARQLIASPSLLRNYSLLNLRSWWELQCNENGAKFVYQTPGPLLIRAQWDYPCRPKFHNQDLHSWNWIGNLILKLVCFLQLFDLSAPSVV